MIEHVTDPPADETEDRPPRVWVIDPPPLEPQLGRCSHTMKGRTKAKRTKTEAKIYRAGWHQRCPNAAVVEYRGRRYCAAHQPARAARTGHEGGS